MTPDSSRSFSLLPLSGRRRGRYEILRGGEVVGYLALYDPDVEETDRVAEMVVGAMEADSDLKTSGRRTPNSTE